MPPEDILTIEPTDLFNLKFVLSASFSPDGEKVIFSVAHVETSSGLGHTQIWLFDQKANSSQPLTSGKASDYHPAWSPDGQQIAFLSTRDGSAQIYLISAAGGEEIKLTDLPNTILDGPVWSPDGTQIAFTAGPAQPPHQEGEPYRVTRHITRIDGGGNPDFFTQDIQSIHIQNRQIKRWTKDACLNDKPRWSPNGQEILFLASLEPESYNINPQPKIVDADGKITEILPDWGFILDINWMPDGNQLVFIGQEGDKPAGTKNDIWIVGRNSNHPVCRTNNLFHGVGSGLQSDMPVLWDSPLKPDPSGNYLFYNVQVGGTTRIFQIALQGKESWEPQIFGEFHAVLMDSSVNHLLFSASSMSIPPELFLSDIGATYRIQITNFNTWLPENRRLPHLDHFNFPSIDGEQIEGWLLVPSPGNAPYPTIVYIHDGPHAACGHIFNFECQMLAGAGFAVLQINHRSSSGYGNDFSTCVMGKWGTLDYQDIIAGLDRAVQKGICDPMRLGIFGKADGGRLASWAITQTGRFKSAVIENPLTDWKSFYITGDSGVWACTHELGGKPEDIPQVYAKCSPLTHAHQCTTPVLFVVSDKNEHIPPEQSLQFYTTLKVNGCTAKMLRLPESSHNASTLGMPIMRHAQNEALLSWMQYYLGG
ncbi:MAG: S9 family peptidase [Anaerolineaceae bacterium]|nr:S9 family peptidase [Anaerolineaceae bacterium]